MNSYIDCNKVFIDTCELGLGVFASRNIRQGEVVEYGLMIPLKNVDGNENPHLHTWSDDRKTWASSSGCLAYYNHSDDPNVQKWGDLKQNTMTVVALKNIRKGTELRSKYMSKPWRKCFQTF